MGRGVLSFALGARVIGHLPQRARAQHREESLLGFESFLVEQQARIVDTLAVFRERARQRELAMAPYRREDSLLTTSLK